MLSTFSSCIFCVTSGEMQPFVEGKKEVWGLALAVSCECVGFMPVANTRLNFTFLSKAMRVVFLYTLLQWQVKLFLLDSTESCLIHLVIFGCKPFCLYKMNTSFPSQISRYCSFLWLFQRLRLCLRRFMLLPNLPGIRGWGIIAGAVFELADD